MDSSRFPPPGGGTIPNFLINKDSEISELKKRLSELETFCRQLKEENEKLKLENKSVANYKASKNNENEIEKIHYETDEEELALETNWIPKKIISDQELAKNQFTIKLLNNDIYKINVIQSDDYRSITKMLTESGTPWYSYENKQTRPIKVMVKNLHYSCDPKSIIADLKNQGLDAINACNKLKWKTKEPLNMFLVTFDPKEDVKKIYNIKHILHSIVKVEPVKLSNLIPQCKICQAFGHTKNYCGKEPRCVKCSGKHSTIDCKKLSDQKAKCCNCGQDHPANYRGCVVAKELQKIRDKKNFKPTIQNNRAESTGTTNGVTQSNGANTLKAKELSFAEVTKKSIKKMSRQVMMKF